MTDARIARLERKGLDRAVASALVMAGYATPKAIKAATDTALKRVESIGPVTVAEIRDKVG